MTISELAMQSGGTTTAKGGQISKNSERLDKDIFLKLLVKQMQYQNPLKPMDNTEFTAQLAQFAGLDQLYAMNDQLQLSLKSQDINNKTNTASLIGKEVKASGSVLELSENKPAAINYELSDNAAEVEIDIYGSNGNIVRTINEVNKQSGVNSLVWDGRDKFGNKLDPGEYVFTVAAKDINGGEIGVSSSISGMVTGVIFNQDIPYLLVDNHQVPLADVIEIKE
ncbi:MAG: flagellar hook assembly protein FlgD [Nitrospirota bacterium]